MTPFLFLMSCMSGRFVIDLDYDEDNDGFTTKEGDCWDNPNEDAWPINIDGERVNPADIHPGAPEIRHSRVDDNCNGWDDEDWDGDGFRVLDDDCDDHNSSVFPGSIELNDDLQNDCNADNYVDGVNYLNNLVKFGGQVGDHAGVSLAGGDLNGDGYSDIVAGGERANSEAGVSYAVFGHDNPWEAENSLADADAVVDGDSENDQSGSSVAACDLDGDGFADWAVGALAYDASASNGGGVALFLGSADFAGSFAFGNADTLWWGSSTGANAGVAIACGHVNTQETATLLVGASGLNGAQGGVYLVQADTLSGSLQGEPLNGYADGDRFGSAIDASNDVTGDGLLDDVLVGSPGDSSNGVSAGAAYLFPGGKSIDNNSRLALYEGNSAYDAAGTAVALLPDIDGDGYGEVAIGAPFHDGASEDGGMVAINQGPFDPDLESKNLRDSDILIDGLEAGGEFGLSLATIDFDQDGTGDLVVGSLNDINGEDSGAAYLYLGRNLVLGSSFDTSLADATFVGEAASHSFVLANLGNVNGQAYDNMPAFDDLGIGAPDTLGRDGAFYLVFGQATEKQEGDL